MTGWLSTCRVALPPLRVKRTTWYLPSFTMTAGSSMVMSSVPTLKMTPIFPWSCRQKKHRINVTHWTNHIYSKCAQNEFPSTSGLLSQKSCLSDKSRSFVTWTVCLVFSFRFSTSALLNRQLRFPDLDQSWQNPAVSLVVEQLVSLSVFPCSCQPSSKVKAASQASLWVALIRNIGNCVGSLWLSGFCTFVFLLSNCNTRSKC